VGLAGIGPNLTNIKYILSIRKGEFDSKKWSIIKVKYKKGGGYLPSQKKRLDLRINYYK
jgi:hypothetical protein